MRYGVSLIMRGREATPEAFVQVAALAEGLRLDGLWCSSHIVIPPQTRSGYIMIPGLQHPENWKERYWEPFAVLGYLAARTERVRLGTSVTVLPMHNPFEIAKQIAEVDQLSGGRFVFGAGVGWFEEEFEVLGQDYHTRGARTDEALRLMQALWHEEPVTFAGRYYACENAHFAPKPVQSPHPPIWIAGHSEAALRRAARFADAWHPVRMSLEDLARARRRLGELLEAEGREPGSVSIAYKTPLLIRDSNPAQPQSFTDGDPRTVADAIRRFAEADVDEFVLDVRPESLAATLDTMQRFAQEVRPLLEDLDG